MNGNINENFNKYTEDLKRLTALSENLYHDLEKTVSSRNRNTGKVNKETLFSSSYQQWYSETVIFLRQVLPCRLDEFEFLYQGSPKRKYINAETYAIRDWLLGIRLPDGKTAGEKDCDIVVKKFRLQCLILGSAKVLFESSLANVDPELRSVFDDKQSASTRERIRNAGLRGLEAGTRLMKSYLNIIKPED
jgi:hypothetical protein